jgi:hypothetical protein
MNPEFYSLGTLLQMARLDAYRAYMNSSRRTAYANWQRYVALALIVSELASEGNQ